MYFLLLNSVLLLVYFNSFVIANNSSELKLVFMVHRHGARTPVSIFPTNPNANASYLSIGLGQLTNTGKERMFQLGHTIRDRYNEFLGISPRVVQIRSANVERCLQSVSALMAGMFRPQESWQWNDNLGQFWQPFPIQTVPQACDGMLNQPVCLAITQETSRINNEQRVDNFLQSKQQLLELVSHYSGTNATDLLNASLISDNLFNDKINGLKLPEWVTNDVYKGLTEIKNNFFTFSTSTRLIQRLLIGLLLKDIVGHMNETINGTASPSTDSPKFYIYSTHDLELALLLSALNIFDNKEPPYGSTVLIELIKDTNNYAIRVYYLKPTESEEPIELHLPDCSDNKNECHFTQFVDSITDLLPINWFSECNNEDQSACLNAIEGL